ncbi:MAG: hypothetical protein P8Y53_23840 [Pseudolabrys sp.]
MPGLAGFTFAADGDDRLRGMEDIRDTRPWFWILIAALAAVAIVALVIAISANSQSIDEKKVVNDATTQIKEEVAGLNGAIEAAEQFQEESNELAKRDQQEIKTQVDEAVAGGEKELQKLKKRVSSLESEMTAAGNENEKLAEGQEELEAEVAELEKRVTKLEK